MVAPRRIFTIVFGSQTHFYYRMVALKRIFTIVCGSQTHFNYRMVALRRIFTIVWWLSDIVWWLPDAFLLSYGGSLYDRMWLSNIFYRGGPRIVTKPSNFPCNDPYVSYGALNPKQDDNQPQMLHSFVWNLHLHSFLGPMSLFKIFLLSIPISKGKKCL